MNRSYSVRMEVMHGRGMTNRTKNMHNGKSHERSAKPPRGPPPSFLGARGNVQIREILKGQWDLLGRGGMKTNSRRGH